MSDKNTKCSKLHYADGSSISVRHDEIDLLRIVDTLLAAKWYIIIFAFISALLGAAVFSFLPQRWTSESLITPAEQTQWYELQKMLSELQVLGVEVNVSRNDVFNHFIKKMKSQSLFREYLETSPFIINELKGISNEPTALYHAVVDASEHLKVVNNNATSKKDVDKVPYTEWTLSFTAPTAEYSQTVLSGYIERVSGLVQREIIQNIHNALNLKISKMQAQLALDRVRFTNMLHYLGECLVVVWFYSVKH
ncbi:hypothetical protein AB1683_004811 [Escherichia coli]